MEIYPVRAIFPATVEEQARASLTFSLTQTVPEDAERCLQLFGALFFMLLAQRSLKTRPRLHLDSRERATPRIRCAAIEKSHRSVQKCF